MGWLISAGIIILGFMSGVANGSVGGDDALLVCTFWGMAGVMWYYAFNKWNTKKKENPAPVARKVIEIPEDAHDAVSRFAWLCNLTRNRIKAMNGISDDYFSNAQIAFYYGSSDVSNKADFWFSFDWAMDGFHETMGYELGEGLRVQDSDRLAFSSNQISALKAWVDMKSSEYHKDKALEIARLVALTFTNECPDAYVKDSQVFEDGLYVSFKFR